MLFQNTDIKKIEEVRVRGGAGNFLDLKEALCTDYYDKSKP